MPPLTRQRAEELVQAMRNRKIVVLGDVMLDEFVWGDVTRISPEAPVPVVDIRRESVHLGGAANVLANVVALGAQACVVGVVGDDSAGQRLRASLKEASPIQADDYLVVDSGRPSTTKTRIIAHNQLVVRADREQRKPVNGNTEKRILASLKQALQEADAFVVSDYDKGVVTQSILGEILPAAYERVPVLIDPKIRNFAHYRPASLITPNHHEALRMTNLEEDSDDGLHQAARVIQEKLSCDAVLITRGDRGIMLLERGSAPVFVETAAREVYDVTGAGDTVIATLAAALAAGATVWEAANLANHAAGIVVGKVGTATASAAELLATFA
ncbi:MAG TPA: D-glycero-beta-D-manno-heptose-7-phosphate kinase [Blastocatellia bacterium]|jgi:D-beta-D-heptose 7-phosphate kinase/D-beta-D-heptose 1-phosphate adenosyltransferase|nr:D-glycero-beta-D-manno-heptose-7-phosphate kinase [Blastocatellia bacterium]HCX29429.1 D-glycero-beta-D-manno-heptose-7-phosphate kinase [Blastocatellia bacterium]